jgi:hypothetical protein
MAENKEKELLSRMIERYRLMYEADSENRENGMDNLRFATIPGEQWELNQKQERGDRPCYEFNKIRINGKKIINEIRANRPGGKAIGTEEGDVGTAEILTGLIRNILNNSDFDSVTDYEAEYQVFAGMGAWRLTTDYKSEDSFEQCIKVEAIENPFCLFSDPFCRDPLKRDADDWILTEKISKDEYERRWPKKKLSDINFDNYDNYDDWMSDDSVRIGEYWYKEQYDKEIWQLQDGKVVDASTDEAKYIPSEDIKKKRALKANKIMMFIASGESILEGPHEWAGERFPFVQIYGEYFIVDGKAIWYGLPQWAKDPQRSYNITRTAATESVMLAPQAKFWATEKQADGYTDQWAIAHKQNFPFRLYNPDPEAPGAPPSSPGPDIPIGLINESALSSKEIDDVTGVFADDRGQQFSQSGRAIYARQQQGRITTFNYQDNITKGVKLTWELLVDLIPKIYDTEQELRVLGSDGAENYVRINTFVQGPNGEPIKINDLSIGRYDVVISSSPSFETRRQEAAETYQTLMQNNPTLFGVAGDLIVKSFDLPYAEEISQRIKAILPPEVKQELVKNVPPEVQQLMAQAQQSMQQVQLQMQQVEAAAQQVQKDQADNDKTKAEIGKLMANVKAEEAKFQAEIAQTTASLAEEQFKIDLAKQEIAFQEKIAQERNTLDGVRMELESHKQELAQFANAALQSALSDIINSSDQFIQAAHTANMAMEDMKTKKPKIIRIEARRVNGKLFAEPVYEETVLGGTEA